MIEYMKKLRIFGVIILVLLIVLGGAGWWFYGLAAMPDRAPEQMRLVIEKGGVFITKNQSGFEEMAHSGMEVHKGDMLRTDADSQASIMIEGRADIRLDEKTQVRITEADIQNVGSFSLKWQLEAGRVWSRLLRLLDMQSAFEGSTNDVVITVRGTAFALQKKEQGTEAFVSHAAIWAHAPEDVQDINRFLLKDDSAFFGQKIEGVRQSTSTVSKVWGNDDWVKQNREADEKFLKAAAKYGWRSLLNNAKTEPDDWKSGLGDWSEKLHLMFSGEKKAELQASYLGRHLGYVYDLIERGKTGLAYHYLSNIESDITKILQDQKQSDVKPFIADVLGKVVLALSDVGQNDVLYRYKLRMEDLYVSLWYDDPARAMYVRSLIVDARLDEAEKLECAPGPLLAIQEAIQAVEQALLREKTEQDKVNDVLDATSSDLLAQKMDLQAERLKRLKEKFETCKASPIKTGLSDTATSTDMIAPTSTNDGASTSSQRGTVIAPADTQNNTNPNNPDTNSANQTTSGSAALPKAQPITTNTSTQPAANLGLTRIELYVQPNPIYVGDTANLYVKGYKSDGTTIDVTLSAIFNLIGDLGSLIGAKFQASKIGSMSIQAVVKDGTSSLTAQASIQINERVTLSRIEITSVQGKQVYLGGSLPLTATAYYTNGFSKNVTDDAIWSVSNSLGHMSGNTFVANMVNTGIATVSAQYSDGISKTGMMDIEVISSTKRTVY